jgi:hypothetical protein
MHDFFDIEQLRVKKSKSFRIFVKVVIGQAGLLFIQKNKYIYIYIYIYIYKIVYEESIDTPCVMWNFVVRLLKISDW